MAQLDGLRALAVLAVMVHHYHDVQVVQLGLAGVKLFFVLSGFLITGILLKARDQIGTGCLAFRSAVSSFYIRRTLRIFPLYYFVVIAGIVLGVQAARDGAAWFLLYLSNFYVIELGWFPAHFAHFWSLAVEEQFYLVWPWLVLLLPMKWLWRVTFLAIFIGAAYRFFAVVTEIPDPAGFVSTFACLDSLGLGALLALLWQERPALLTARASWGGFLAGAGLLALAVAVDSVAWRYALGDLGFSLSAACLVDRAARGLRGPAGAALASRPFTYTGRISYGLYVYHPLMPGIWGWVSAQTGMLASAPESEKIAVYWLSAFLAASLSWHVFEGPLNRLKDRFAPSQPPPPSPVPASSAVQPPSIRSSG